MWSRTNNDPPSKLTKPGRGMLHNGSGLCEIDRSEMCTQLARQKLKHINFQFLSSVKTIMLLL